MLSNGAAPLRPPSPMTYPMPHPITLENTDEVFTSKEDVNLLQAMEQLRRKGIPVGCRNGGCGVCKVRVVEGEYVTQKMSRGVLSEAEEKDRYTLACKTYARSALRVQVVGKMVKAIQAQGRTPPRQTSAGA